MKITIKCKGCGFEKEVARTGGGGCDLNGPLYGDHNCGGGIMASFYDLETYAKFKEKEKEKGREISDKELDELEREASQPTIEDQRDTLDKEIREAKERLYKLQIKRLKL